MDIDSLLSLVKKKKELEGLSGKVVEGSILVYLDKNKISAATLDSMSDRDLKFIVKEIRSELRLYHGRFSISSKKRNALLGSKDFLALLKTHSSTKERLDFYPKLKELISSLNVRSILDLGCGLNPISLAEKRYSYFACDINEAELSLVREYFKINDIDSKVFVCDLRDEDIELPNADLCLVFKVLDILDKKSNAKVENLLKRVNSSYILASFATKTLSGKPMKNKRRFWFESILKKLGLYFKIIESKNEIFYLISKK